LLKPKVNPLEGDLSLRSNVGKWWQKDTSAVHVLPFVSVVEARGLGGVFSREGGGGGGDGEEGEEEGGSSSRNEPGHLSFVLRLRNPLNGTFKVALVPPPSSVSPLEGEKSSSSSSSSSNKTTTLYYLKRLSVALGSSSSSSSSSSGSGGGSNKNMLYAHVPTAGNEEGREGGKKEEEAELEAFEDEYLEDEEEDGDQETLDALALQILGTREKVGSSSNSSSNSSSSSSTVLLQRKSRAWLHVVVPPPACPLSVEAEAAVGVLLFLRLTSDRNEFSGTRGEAASIVVPVCLAFTRRSADGTVGDLTGRMTRLGLG